MTITLDEYYERVRRLVADESETFEDDIMNDAVQSTVIATTKYLPKKSSATLTVGSDGLTYLLPTDTYQVFRIINKSLGKILGPATLGIDEAIGEYNIYDEVEYYLRPYGYVSLTRELANSDGNTDLTLMYDAYWSVPTSGSANLEIPDLLINAMVYHSGSYLMVAKASNVSEFRTYLSKRDSGTPIQNPPEMIGNMLLKRFYEELSRIPKDYFL